MKKLLTITVATAVALSMSLQAADQLTKGFNNPIPEQIMTPDRVKTSIGTFKFDDGMPTEKSAQMAYDYLDQARGVESFLRGIPAASIEGLRLGLASIGATDSNQIVLFDNLMDSNPLFLTGNTDTVYASVFLDLEKDGVTVVEVPAGSGPGTVNDAWFRFVTDMGVPGPDRGQGGTYIVLPPDYDGNLKPTEGLKTTKVVVGGKKKDVWIAQSTSYTNWMILRGFLKDGSTANATKMYSEGLKVYALAKANNPPEMEVISGSKQIFNTIHANNFEFYHELHNVLEKEPISVIDPEIRGTLAYIGLEKGKPFNPDARMKKILTDAVAIGNASARAMAFRSRDDSALIYNDRLWRTAFVGGSYEWLKDDGNGGRNLDARSLFFYIATVNTPAMTWKLVGKGSQYALAYTDKNGDYFNGKKTYKLHVPAGVPAKDFWSVVVYDPQTRSELQTDQPFPSKNNKRDQLIYNDDGSVDLYFAPKPPKGKEANWVQTVPGKNWFSILRLYGPLEPWFEKSWKPGDFERVK